MLVFKVWTENKWIIKENRKDDIITKYNRRVFPLNNIHKYILSGGIADKQKKKLFQNLIFGLQSRSSENGKTAMWHYGLKLQ